MTRFVLDNEFDYELLLAGISSHARDYRLCWSLNGTLNLQLARKEKGLTLPAGKKDEMLVFNLFEYDDEESRTTYALIANKTNGGFLIPELRHADYLLMLRNNIYLNFQALLEKVRSSDQVLTAFEINAEELKSRDNLIYF